jgi:hypothetical protein
MVRIGTLIDIFNWVVSLAAEDTPRGTAPRETCTQVVDDIALQIAGMRIRFYAATVFARHHGLDKPSPALRALLAEQGAGLAKIALEDPTQKTRLLAALKSARTLPMEEADKVSEVFTLIFRHQEQLNRAWVKEMIQDILDLAEVHGKTAGCLDFTKAFARELGCSIRRKSPKKRRR